MSTVHDREILNHIFNPLLPLNGELVQEEEIAEEDRDLELIEEDETNSRSREFELQGIREAELGHFDEAIDLLSKSIKIAPLRASGYNNRAQTYRLLGQIEEAKVDLNNAINLSCGKGRAGCQALCQRGLIALKENRSEDAKVDFEAASKLGSQFAKAQLVQMNPYAALCNRMLKDVMGKLQRGESEYYRQDTGTKN